MKNTMLFLLLAGLIFAASCKKNKEEPDPTPSDQLIDPANSNALNEVLIMPNGAIEVNGAPPSPSSSSAAPIVLNNTPSVLSSNGSTAPLNFSYDNVNGNLGGCYVQVNGANSYYNVPYGANSGSAGDLQLPIGIPTNVDQGEFCITFCVYDNQGRVSNNVTTCVTLIRLGTGALQISLSWNTASDQDLYVTDPNGIDIYFGNSSTSSGGQLDRDDTDGYGPENIYWTSAAPDGTYSVRVNDFDGTSFTTTYYVTLNGPGMTRSFSGTTSNGSTANVVTFTKNGNSFSF